MSVALVFWRSPAVDLPLALAAVVGIAFLAGSITIHMRYDRGRHERAAADLESLFPSP